MWSLYYLLFVIVFQEIYIHFLGTSISAFHDMRINYVLYHTFSVIYSPHFYSHSTQLKKKTLQYIKCTVIVVW